ncbi:hypothetical protein UPYG_G00324150 [Umbra pygmaea]|uniref:Swi5-dependent recombination DNA repair protein 1 homolog n=1 Tax=Umbra pygmaea TaxID=75934 RepID=A0ABD0WIH4_UMBPY
MENTPKSTEPKCVSGTPYRFGSSPCDSSEKKPKQQMSSSLKERLKRSRRSFTSPVSVVKRLKIDEDEEQKPTDKQMNAANRGSTPPRDSTDTRKAEPSGCLPEPSQSTDLLQLRDQLRIDVRDRTETLRRLKMVEMYRSKNDLTQLRVLIDKWRSCCQAALYDLQSDFPVDGKKASISQLIHLFGLEEGILHFDRNEEDFISS